MGKILNGILGGVSGKVGGVIGSNWKGIKYIRAYAVPANPNTPAQQAQRAKLRGCVRLAKSILAEVIQTYWDPKAVQESGFNTFMSKNLKLWTSGADFVNAIVAQGDLESETISATTYDAVTGDLRVDWTPAGLGNGSPADTAIAVVFDDENNVAFVDDSVTRVAGDVIMGIGIGRDPAELHSYLFFSRGVSETLMVSLSDYAVVAPL